MLLCFEVPRDCPWELGKDFIFFSHYYLQPQQHLIKQSFVLLLQGSPLASHSLQVIDLALSAQTQQGLSEDPFARWSCTLLKLSAL